MSEQPWREPGVRLMDTMMTATDRDDTLSSAVPVFIGWRVDDTADDAVRLEYLTSWDRAQRNNGEVAPYLWETVRHYFDNGGGPCYVLVGNMPRATILSVSKMQAWWDQFLKAECGRLLTEPSITLVAVPQLVWLGEQVNASEMSASPPSPHNALILLWQVLLQACSSRPDLFFVLDAPREPTVASDCIVALRSQPTLGDAAQRVALYGPHLMTDYPDPDNLEVFCVVPPCGAVLGVYVRSDAMAGVWKAPANEPLWHVVKPEFRETLAVGWFDVEKAPINLIRSFAGRGTRVWGCRTLASGTPFRYVQVRRAVTWIEANLKQICRFAVFEPNNEITWFQLRGLCSAWLRRVWLEGGLAGADETSAYSVRVGVNESMTAADVAAGRLIIQVGVAVLHAAELIEVTLELTVGDHPKHFGSEST
ncbi:Phage tail sheath protein [Serratia entomophila]|nr:Phage tail sheath protein [Serratia entomophila]